MIKNIIIFHEMLFWEFELGLLSCCHDCSHIWEPFFWNRPLKLCVGRIFFFSHTILSFRVYIIFSKKNLSTNLFSHKFLRMWEDHGGKTHLRENFSLENDTQTRSFPSGGKLIKKLIPRDFKQLRRRLVYK